jgi:hypothetical protein
MTTNIRLSEMLGIVATIDPDANTAAALITDEIDMSKWSRVMFIVQTGILGTSGTLDLAIKGGASTNAGSHATAVTGKSITQLVKATNDDDQVILEVSAEECAAQGLNFIEGTFTIGTATSDCSLVAIGLRSDYSNVTSHDLASVVEIVA